MNKVIGICSLCGGKVVIPTYYLSTVDPTPKCTRCGAYKKENLPTIEMERFSYGFNPDREDER